VDSGNKISKQITKIKNNQKNRIYEKGNIYRLHRYHGGTISQKAKKPGPTETKTGDGNQPFRFESEKTGNQENCSLS